MELGDLIMPEAVIPTFAARSKKQVLQDLAEHAASLTQLSARDIFETLLQRERLGSTAVGRGIAIPHGQVAGLGAHRRRLCAPAAADRFRSARRGAGRPRIPAAGAGARRCRPPEGPGARVAAGTRAPREREAQGRARRRGNLRDPDRADRRRGRVGKRCNRPARAQPSTARAPSPMPPTTMRHQAKGAKPCRLTKSSR